MTEKTIKTLEDIGDARLRRMLGAPPLPCTPPLPAGERKHGGPPLPVPLLKACRVPSTEQQLELNLSVARRLLSAALPPLARLHEVGAAHSLVAPVSFTALCSKPPPGTDELASVAGVFLTSLETACVVPAAPDGRAASAWLRAVLSSPMEVLPFLPPEVLCRIARRGGLPQVPDGRVVVCMTREADMWALGMTAWAVVCGSGTPGGHPGRELQAAASPRFSGGSGLLATHFLAQARRGFEDHPLWGRLPLELRALLAATLVWEPERRATARQLLDSALVAREPKPVLGFVPRLRPPPSLLLLARRTVVALHARADRAAGAASLQLPAFDWTFEDDREQFMAMIDPRTRDVWGRPRWEPYDCAHSPPEGRPNPVVLLAAGLREWLRMHTARPRKATA